MPVFEFKGRTYNNPVELALEVVGGKWKMPILWRLNERVYRFGELQQSVGRVTPKMLTQQLRELEADGLVRREVFPVVPPKVEYSITELGRSVIPVIRDLREWGTSYRTRSAQG